MTVKTYRLWDIDINRLFGTFDDEAEALDLVRTLLSTYGEAYAEVLVLGCERGDGSFTQPLTGAALVERAQGTPVGLDRPRSRSIEVSATSTEAIGKSERRKAG